ncbi:Pyridine nucleotide-disulfide oxidoreductase domain-containing protein 2 [Geodia barretti]|uniref:Pyridine nucleotide-disulfide oxidoreductase domain-containing protein 2 n=1 Tax=Geodia barretti TaxID=519541 RepID=A0AA35WDM8_GEOBA|nr:Pyridine nucleotide-disulfide oxidoreductase domain-containing protein 2 [Geodia barretti]
MTNHRGNGKGEWDAIVVGGGHNGLVCAAYMGKAGLRVLVLESREVFGGPSGSFEFMPGYTASFSNSPGSLETRVVEELDLPGAGLRFLRSDPTVIQFFPEHPFVVWRDMARVCAQLDALCPGEGDRYRGFVAKLEDFATRLRTSIFKPAPGLPYMAAGLTTEEDRDTFEQTNEARTLLGLLASNSGMVPQSAPGTACGLILRPLAMASAASLPSDDFRRMPLRGSTGHPIGGMGAIIDSITARCRGFGGTLKLKTRVARILHNGGQARGVECENGAVYTAPIVVSAINPKTLFGKLLDDEAVGSEMRDDVQRFPMRGAAFKMALALDGIPTYANLPDDLTQEQASTCQKDKFAKRCIETVSRYMPDLPDHIIDYRSFSPVDCEAELGIIGSNITHGEMLPHNLFGPRPHRLANDYRTPLKGLYLTGGGVWPGGFVTGVPGRNTSQAVLADLQGDRESAAPVMEAVYS